MSQIRKIRRKQDKRRHVPEGGKKWMAAMIVFAVVFVVVMAVMGFQNLSRAPGPEEARQSLSNPPMELLASNGQSLDPSHLVRESETGAVFLFFLGAG